MTRAGLQPESYVECTSEEETVTTVHSLLTESQPPTALFAANNLTMRYLLHATSVLKIEVPRQIALAGFDDFDIADVLRPALTVVRQTGFQLEGAAAHPRVHR